MTSAEQAIAVPAIRTGDTFWHDGTGYEATHDATPDGLYFTVPAIRAATEVVTLRLWHAGHVLRMARPGRPAARITRQDIRIIRAAGLQPLDAVVISDHSTVTVASVTVTGRCDAMRRVEFTDGTAHTYGAREDVPVVEWDPIEEDARVSRAALRLQVVEEIRASLRGLAGLTPAARRAIDQALERAEVAR